MNLFLFLSNNTCGEGWWYVLSTIFFPPSVRHDFSSSLDSAHALCASIQESPLTGKVGKGTFRFLGKFIIIKHIIKCI